MKVDFSEGSWSREDFDRITSLRSDCRVEFMQENNCVVNDDRVLPRGSGEYHYISLLSKQSVTSPAVLETGCSFDEFGAPLLVLTDDVIKTEDGFPAYGHHFEIVAFEDGFNIWELNGTDKPIKAAFARFKVPEKTPVTLRAVVDSSAGTVTVTLCGNTVCCEVGNLPDSFRAGITACEGINRFYSLSIEEA